MIHSLLQNVFIISVRYRINTAVDREVNREPRHFAFFQLLWTRETRCVARGWDRINSSERLTIILLIELNTCTCGGLCKRSFMRIVRTFSVDKLERAQSRGKTSETKSMLWRLHFDGFRVKNAHLVSSYISQMDSARAFVFTLRASSEVWETSCFLTWSMKDNSTYSQSMALIIYVASHYTPWRCFIIVDRYNKSFETITRIQRNKNIYRDKKIRFGEWNVYTLEI